jgi:hypothetical protein
MSALSRSDYLRRQFLFYVSLPFSPLAETRPSQPLEIDLFQYPTYSSFSFSSESQRREADAKRL